MGWGGGPRTRAKEGTGSDVVLEDVGQETVTSGKVRQEGRCNWNGALK